MDRPFNSLDVWRVDVGDARAHGPADRPASAVLTNHHTARSQGRHPSNTRGLSRALRNRLDHGTLQP